MWGVIIMKLTINEHDNGCFRVGTNVIFDDEFVVTDYGNITFS